MASAYSLSRGRFEHSPPHPLVLPFHPHPITPATLTAAMSAAHKQATGEPSTSPGSQSSSSPALATSFPSFSLLPPEIANRILTLACRSPEPSCKDAKEAKRRSPLSLDVATTLSLTLVSRAVSKVATTVLWETIRITKPSALLELYAAVREKPELAERIEHLHAGAEVMMPASEWPLSISYSDWSIHGGPMLSLSASFKGGDAAQRLPQGIIYGLPWPVQPQQKRLSDSREVAIGAAIEAALECINLDPYKRGYGLSGAIIGLVSQQSNGLAGCGAMHLLMSHSALVCYALLRYRRSCGRLGILSYRPCSTCTWQSCVASKTFTTT